MKKLAAVLLAAALSMSLAACGSGTNAALAAPADQTSAQQVIAAEAEKDPAAEQEPEAAPAAEKLPFEPFTAIDNDKYSVAIKEIDPDDPWGYLVKIDFGNKTSHWTYGFLLDISVNGVYLDLTISSPDLAPGKHTDLNLYVPDALKALGITDYTDIKVEVTAMAQNGGIYREEPFHIYPYGEEKAAKFVRESQASDVVLAENDSVSVVLTGLEGSNSGYILNLFIENKSDEDILINADQFSVNGYQINGALLDGLLDGLSGDDFLGDDLMGLMNEPVWRNGCKFKNITLPISSIEKRTIDEIETIEFHLSINDWSTWKPVWSTRVSIEI